MMKKILLLGLIPFALSAKDSSLYDGYSYFGFGSQSISYKEDYTYQSGEKIKSSADASSPIYISGSLVRVNEQYDFSIDFASTILPTQITEKWQSDWRFVQQNKFDATINSMQLLGHYKLTDNHRIVAGPGYSLNSYKRYEFKDQNGNYLTDPHTNAKYGLLEERVATLYISGGYWFESIPHATQGEPRFKFATLLSLPIWNQATNTEFEKVTFDSTSGYRFEVNGYAGYPIMDGLEIGLFGRYSIQKKSKTDTIGSVHWPENTLTQLQMGINAVWNFNTK